MNVTFDTCSALWVTHCLANPREDFDVHFEGLGVGFGEARTLKYTKSVIPSSCLKGATFPTKSRQLVKLGAKWVQIESKCIQFGRNGSKGVELGLTYCFFYTWLEKE